MVFTCSESTDRSPKAAAELPDLSPVGALEVPTFKWGATRLLRCQLPGADHKISPKPFASFPEIKKKNASFKIPPPHKGGVEKGNGKKEKIAEFRPSLTKDEIDEDFFAMTGARAPRRPSRRPKAVQEKIKDLFPGRLLPKTIAPDRYRVPD